MKSIKFLLYKVSKDDILELIKICLYISSHLTYDIYKVYVNVLEDEQTTHGGLM